jgi:AcrR family transcriptional regulator
MGTLRAERTAATRQKLLDAAVEQFRDKPYDEVSIQDIATEAGVAYGLVAHHFGNKRGIQLEAIREIARRLDPQPPPQGPASTQIRHLARVRFASIERYPVAWVGLIRGADPESRAVIDASRQRGIRLVGQILGLDPERPVLRLTMRSCLAAADEIAVAWLQDGRPFPVEDIIEMLMATTAEMLRQAVRLDPEIDATQALAALARP